MALARAIVGQQLAGAAVRKIWGRLEEAFPTGVTPKAILAEVTRSDGDREKLRSTVGLSNAKVPAFHY